MNRLWPTVLLFASLSAASNGDARFRSWGEETLARIEADLWLPERGLYADSATAGADFKRSGPSFMWGCGVQLSALAAASRLDRKRHAAQLRRYADGLECYWVENDGIWGFDVLPAPKPPDRYYDDNAWMVLAFLDGYDATHEASYLRKAEETYRFVLSGEDDKLGGGIYWHEQNRNCKNTCINGPAIVGALRLYQKSRSPQFLQTATRLYGWVVSHLQDADGLFWDNENLDGGIDRTKWSYNAGLMLRANAMLYEVTREKRYLDEARRIANSAANRWVDPATGGIRDGGPFAHLLLEGFLALYDADHDGRWLDIVRRAVIFVHEHVRDQNGRYANNWASAVTQPLEKFTLLDQASAARAFLVTARYP